MNIWLAAAGVWAPDVTMQWNDRLQIDNNQNYAVGILIFSMLAAHNTWRWCEDDICFTQITPNRSIYLCKEDNKHTQWIKCVNVESFLHEVTVNIGSISRINEATYKLNITHTIDGAFTRPNESQILRSLELMAMQTS